MKPKIKVCGIKTIKEIKIINSFPIHYAGFIFAPSIRQVTTEQVLDLKKNLRKDIKTVGVFVNAPIDYINYIVETCYLDIVQLHGEETEDYCKSINTSVWKAMRIKDKIRISELDKYLGVKGILLDTYSDSSMGGTGKTFHWELVKDISKTRHIILAGGLKASNIVEAASIVKPQVLDINSGVEKQSYKDKDLMAQVFHQLQKGRII